MITIKFTDTGFEKSVNSQECTVSSLFEQVGLTPIQTRAEVFMFTSGLSKNRFGFECVRDGRPFILQYSGVFPRIRN